jgi:hypothetical protein
LLSRQIAADDYNNPGQDCTGNSTARVNAMTGRGSSTVGRAVFRWLVALSALALMGGILGSCAGVGIGMLLGVILGNPHRWLNVGQSWGIVVGVAGFVVIGGIIGLLTRKPTPEPSPDAEGSPEDAPEPE